MHIFTRNARSHRECTSAPGMHVLTGNAHSLYRVLLILGPLLTKILDISIFQSYFTNFYNFKAFLAFLQIFPKIGNFNWSGSAYFFGSFFEYPVDMKSYQVAVLINIYLYTGTLKLNIQRKIHTSSFLSSKCSSDTFKIREYIGRYFKDGTW